MKYDIVGTYDGENEVIDATDDVKDAEYLVGEYLMAFGRDWTIECVDTHTNETVIFL